jgi:hypothetical protein
MPLSKLRQTQPISTEARLQRLMLAISAAVCLVLGVALEFVPGMDNSSRKFASGTALKIGVVLGLAWVSAPQLERLGWQRLRGNNARGGHYCHPAVCYPPAKFGAIAAASLGSGLGCLWVAGLVSTFNSATSALIVGMSSDRSGGRGWWESGRVGGRYRRGASGYIKRSFGV